MGNLVYFSAADRQMENFLDKDAFDRSLLLNMLFQTGILVPDILFAISGGLEAHLQTGNLTLFEECVAQGLVVPSFRDASAQTFEAGFKLIEHQKIQGVQESAGNTMRRLQIAADRNKSFRPFVPTAHLGKTFGKRLEELQRKEPPIIGPTFGSAGSAMSQNELRKYWLLTERWRCQSIDAARDATHAKTGEMDVRRGEIMNAVGRDLSPSSSPKIHDIRELFAAYPEKPELRVFFQWVCEIYAYNHAIEMDSIPNLPAYNRLSPVSLRVGGSAPTPLMPYASFPTISETVYLPPLRVLKRVAPQDILKVRLDKGAQYLADLTAWQSDPGNGTREDAVRKSLRAYAAEIVKWSKANSKTPVTVFFSHLSPELQFLTTLGIPAVAGKVLTQSHPLEGAIVGGFCGVVGHGIYAIYKGLDQRVQTQTVTVTAGQPGAQCEVNVDAIDPEIPADI